MNARTLNAQLFNGGGIKAQDPLAIAVRGIGIGFWTAVTDLAVETKESGGDHHAVLNAELDFPEYVDMDFELHGIPGKEGLMWALIAV